VAADAAEFLRIENMTRRFGSVPAVDAVSLDVGRGETLCLLGPSGCGKSTLLRTIAGLEIPDGGRIIIDGEDVTGMPPHQRPVNMMFQSYALFPHMSVARNIAFGLERQRLSRSSINDRVEEEDFRMYRLPRAQAFRAMERADRFPIDQEEIVTGREDSLYTLSVRGILEVQYESESEAHAYLEWAHAHRAPKDDQTSRIHLNTHPIHVDRQGNIVEPYGATLYRYFAFTRRMAHLLPRGYRPSDTSLTATVSSN